MTSPTRGSPLKRKRILDAAGALFAERGFQSTSLEMIAHASGAAVGSIMHYFDDKSRLASAVHDHLADQLAAVVDAALQGHDADVVGAIRSVLASYVDWARTHPNHGLLLFMSGMPAATSGRFAVEGLQQRLAALFGAWSEAPIRAGEIKPLTGLQLYAIILAPAIFATSATSGAEGKADSNADAEWRELLVRGAIAAIVPPKVNAPKRIRQTVIEPRPPAVKRTRQPEQSPLLPGLEPAGDLGGTRAAVPRRRK